MLPSLERFATRSEANWRLRAGSRPRVSGATLHGPCPNSRRLSVPSVSNLDIHRVRRASHKLMW